MLLAALPCVVGFRSALRVGTEVGITLVATNAVLGHALGSLAGDRLAHIVPLVHVDLALYHGHDV
jgi:hypothetical protein